LARPDAGRDPIVSRKDIAAVSLATLIFLHARGARKETSAPTLAFIAPL
jgi:hypothetical protein